MNFNPLPHGHGSLDTHLLGDMDDNGDGFMDLPKTRLGAVANRWLYTTTVAGWIIQAGGMGGYGRNVNQMAGRAGSMAGSVAGAAAGNAGGRVGKLLK